MAKLLVDFNLGPAQSGLAGTCGYTLVHADGTVEPRVTAGITEFAVVIASVSYPTGAYFANPTAPAGWVGGWVVGDNGDTADGPAVSEGRVDLMPGDERAAIAAALLDFADGVETGLTPRNALRLLSAALAGLVSGAEANLPIFKSAVSGTKNRISAATDANGNRSSVTTDLT